MMPLIAAGGDHRPPVYGTLQHDFMSKHWLPHSAT
jgi:hypothetical protein